MSRAARVVLALSLTAALSAPALAAEAGLVARVVTGLKNVKPKLGQKLENLRLGLKARVGGFRENELIVGKTRVFHKTDGSTQKVTRLMSVEQRRLLPEMTVTKERAADGKNLGTTRSYAGNWRRGVGGTLGRAFSRAFSDPDFLAAIKGDKEAGARWDVKRTEMERREKEQAKLPAPVHRFVDAKGKAVYIKELTDQRPE
jgi:hypothetical protein